MRLVNVTIALLLLACSAGPGVFAEIASHQARYNLSLAGAKDDSGIVRADGRMEIRVQSSCDGWNIERNFGLTLSSASGTVEHFARLLGFEASDGSAYWFNSRSFDNRKLAEEVGGVARVGTPGQSNAKYAKPKPVREDLPDNTIFPTAHILHLLEAAETGKATLKHVVFEGTEMEDPHQVSTNIGSEQQAGDSSLGVLSTSRYWPITMTYNEMTASEPSADFSMSVDLFENGIAGDMSLDYGTFSLVAALEEIEMLQEPSCSP